NRFLASCWVILEPLRCGLRMPLVSVLITCRNSAKSMAMMAAEVLVLGGEDGARQHRRRLVDRRQDALDTRAGDFSAPVDSRQAEIRVGQALAIGAFPNFENGGVIAAGLVSGRMAAPATTLSSMACRRNLERSAELVCVMTPSDR